MMNLVKKTKNFEKLGIKAHKIIRFSSKRLNQIKLWLKQFYLQIETASNKKNVYKESGKTKKNLS